MVILLLLACHAHAIEWEESPRVARLFDRAGVEGTFVLYDVSARRFTGHNRDRAAARFIPASTFKIPNTLIGLSTGAVGSVDEVLPYGGKPQPFDTWERDMNLREAIGMSNVAIYRELARRIGLASMGEYVSAMGFGNADIGGEVDRFWLDGPLRISAMEQTAFLAELARDALPYPRKIQASVRDIVRLEQRDDLTLYGKTGWVNAPGPGIGWWVGWVEKGGQVYAFALNMDIRQVSDAEKRMVLGKASLEALGVL